MASLTSYIAGRALDTLLNRKSDAPNTSSKVTDAGSNTIHAVHKVHFRHGLNKAYPEATGKGVQYSSTSLDNVVDTLKAPLLYMCMCETEIYLVDPNNNYTSFKPNFGPGSDPYVRSPPQYLDATGAVNPHIILAIPYSAVSEVVADTTREEVFGLGIQVEEDSKLPYDIPLALRFSFVFRKQLVEDLQAAHNVYHIIHQNTTKQLPVRFAPLDPQQERRIQADASLRDKRLPSFQYFSAKRLPEEYADAKTFYRSEYMFLGSAEMTDKYEALPNRPCSTYVIDTPETLAAQSKGRVAENPRMIVKLLPPRPMTDLSSLTRGRDALGMNVGLEDGEVDAMMLSQAGQSELEFHFWVESIAYALALSEQGGDQFFVPEKGVYHKRLNAVADKCAWECFRVHLFTRHRQIGVIGCRRSFMPPYADSFQDMLFVLYGPRATPLSPAPGFMRTLEMVVDTLSPACAPLPYRESVQVQQLQFRELTRLTAEHMQQTQHGQGHGHTQLAQGQSVTQNSKRLTALLAAKRRTVSETFMDRAMIQARVNALLCSPQQFRWLATRAWLSEPAATIQGVIPRTKFIDVECYSLAIKFCVSVLAKITGSPSNVNVKDEFKPVADPLAIIFRMMAELDQEHEAGEAGPQRVVGDMKPKPEQGYSVKEEWKARIAQYFAFCVDGGVLPEELTLARLVTADAVDDAAVDQVVDFLLYMRRKPKSWRKYPHGFPFVQHNSVIERIDQTDILNGFSCNETVLIALVQAGYFENAVKRHKPELLARLFRSILLTKHYNLKLIRAVCRKIATVRIANEQSLIDPLANLAKVANFYIKAYALHALAALAQQGHDLVIFEKGGVGMAIWNIYTSRSGELIEAALDLLIAVCHTNKLGIQPYAVLTQPDLARKLIHLIAPFEKTSPLQERYHPRVLERVATLMIKLASDRSVLLVLIENLAHQHLARLVEHSSRYHNILVKITSAMGTLYMHAGPLITRPRYTNRLQQERTALCLVETLRSHCTGAKVQLCLNVLIVLRMVLDFWLVPLGTGEKAYKKFWPCVQDRVDLLFKLKDVSSLDLVLERCKLVAEEVVGQAHNNKLLLEQSRDYQHLNERDKVAKRLEFDSVIKLGNGILAKYNWFVACTQYCNSRQRTTRNFQHDGKQLQPLVMPDQQQQQQQQQR